MIKVVSEKIHSYFMFTPLTAFTNSQVVVESTLVSPSKIRPIGTCLMVEGVLKQPSVQGKHAVELKVEKILHIGTVDHDKYPLSRKRLPMDMLRDSAHFRPRTTTVACASIPLLSVLSHLNCLSNVIARKYDILCLLSFV